MRVGQLAVIRRDSVSRTGRVAGNRRTDGYVDDDALWTSDPAANGAAGLVRSRGAVAGRVGDGGDGGIACARLAIMAMATAGSQRVSDMFLTRYAEVLFRRACDEDDLAECFAVSADLASLVGATNARRGASR